MSDETTPSPEVLLYGPVTDEVTAALRAGRNPDVADLKAKFPAVADRLDAFAAELVGDVRAFQAAARRELARAVEGLLAGLRAGELPDPEEMKGRNSMLPGSLQEALVHFVAETRRALWLPRMMWTPAAP